MRMRGLFGTLVALAALPSSHAFNNPSGVDIWCGKAYRATNASFNPGGWFQEPQISTVPLLDLKFRPRMSLYLASDTVGSFLIDATVSNLIGEPFFGGNVSAISPNGTFLDIEISVGNQTVVSGRKISIGSTDNEIEIALEQFLPSLTPYNISLSASLSSLNGSIYTAATELVRLPRRTDGGSSTRLDHLYGGISTQKGNNTEWNLVFPYTYYVQWSLYWYANLSTLDEFASMGYNVIHIVPTGDLGDTPYPWAELEPYLDRADELGLYLQYDVRWDYTNLTTMEQQLLHLRSHPSVLLWYTGDEPDGKSDPINSTAIARDAIRQLDPYHPVSLALNCYDFYYTSYAAGAEILLSDVYPVAVNTSWSVEYDTACNATYGCCGCDDCTGHFEDISARLDLHRHFDAVTGWERTHWVAPQAFGNETFWSRYPTAAEEVVMTLLGINHAAKGVVMWDFPTAADVSAVTSTLAKDVFARSDVVDLLLGAPLYPTLGVVGGSRVDAAAWVADGRALVSVVNLNYANLNGSVEVQLPAGIQGMHVSDVLWGDAEWSIGDGLTLQSQAGILGLGVSLLLLSS